MSKCLSLAVEVGIAMRLAGRTEEAQKLNRETLDLLRREYGEENEVYLICANSLWRRPARARPVRRCARARPELLPSVRTSVPS